MPEIPSREKLSGSLRSPYTGVMPSGSGMSERTKARPAKPLTASDCTTAPPALPLAPVIRIVMSHPFWRKLPACQPDGATMSTSGRGVDSVPGSGAGADDELDRVHGGGRVGGAGVVDSDGALLDQATQLGASVGRTDCREE